MASRRRSAHAALRNCLRIERGEGGIRFPAVFKEKARPAAIRLKHERYSRKVSRTPLSECQQQRNHRNAKAPRDGHIFVAMTQISGKLIRPIGQRGRTCDGDKGQLAGLSKRGIADF